MATTQVYTCDICKQSKDKNSLSNIEIKVTGIRIKWGDSGNPLKFDICHECLAKKGFIVEPVVDIEEDLQAREINKRMLEDKIFEILNDMGVVLQSIAEK